MKKLILSLLISVPSVFAMNKIIKMPEESVLQQELDKIELTHLAEHTNIISELAGQEKTPIGVAMTIELSIFAYIEYLKQGLAEPIVETHMALMPIHKQAMIKALLKDEPDALKQLKEMGLYKPVK